MIKIKKTIEILSDWMWCIVDSHLIPIYKNGEFTGMLKSEWDFYVLYWCLYYPLEWINIWLYRIFVRGKCALEGCKTSYSNFNLPEGCYEWGCNRCFASGIDWLVHTVDWFEKPYCLKDKIYNFIQSIKGK